MSCAAVRSELELPDGGPAQAGRHAEQAQSDAERVAQEIMRTIRR